MAHIIINPAYHHLSDFIESLPTVFETDGELVYDARNQVRLFTVDDMKLAVKRFKKPMLHQRLDYTFFRPSKAKRAYLYGIKLLELGISTPTPVAYIETFSKGLFSQGYLVTEYCGDPDARILREEPEGHDELVEAIAKYLVDCHEKGFIHGDTNLTNFLYHREGSSFHISTIDINRSHFSPNPSKKQCLESLFRLTHVRPTLKRIVARYAALRGWDEQAAVNIVMKKLEKFEKRKKMLKLHR
jgi:tRNA A-37 threonylcarbamoyl transferase component Bud32